VPGVDVSGKSRDDCEANSRGCEYCGASGFATIWHWEFHGAGVETANGRNRLLRTVAYCVCYMGRWLMQAHRQECKAVYARIHDHYDVAAGRVPGWVVDNPQPQPTIPDPTDMSIIPDWRKLVEAFGAKIHARSKPFPRPFVPAAVRDDEEIPF
jgi:hypothetical protein